MTSPVTIPFFMDHGPDSTKTDELLSFAQQRDDELYRYPGEYTPTRSGLE